MKKRFLAVLMTLFVCLPMLPSAKASALVFTPNCTVNSEAAILFNLDIGEVVYEKNADMKEFPAALAQIMTAVVVLEECDDISNVKLTADDALFAPLANYENQSDLRYANISAGDTLTVEDLLYAMMLTSSCEASIMLANHFGDKSEEKFVEKMNAKATELGMTSTRFTNATGLYSARQNASARDMMTLLRYAIKLHDFEAIACAEQYTPATAAAAEKTEDWLWKHSNVMCDPESTYYCQGVRGIKTGNLEEGGRSIALKASRDGNNYLLICMNAPMKDADGNNTFYHLTDAKGIIDWAFTHLTYQNLLADNEEIDEVEVANADGNNYVIVKPKTGYSCIWCDTADIDSIQKVINLKENVKAPVAAGDTLGTIQLKLSGEVLSEIDLIAGSSVERSLWKYNLSIIPVFFRSDYIGKAVKTALILSIVYLGACIFFFVRYKMERKRRRQAKENRAR